MDACISLTNALIGGAGIIIAPFLLLLLFWKVVDIFRFWKSQRLDIQVVDKVKDLNKEPSCSPTWILLLMLLAFMVVMAMFVVKVATA